MKNFFSYFIIILICAYLNHLKFNYNFLFASNFDNLCLFKILILVLEVRVVKNDLTWGFCIICHVMLHHYFNNILLKFTKCIIIFLNIFGYFSNIQKKHEKTWLRPMSCNKFN
jgi:hypothetical protein